MCRIAGIVSIKLSKQNSIEHHVKMMANSMAHGGPDGEGFFFDQNLSLALAHRRLSLIDLSNAGQQPMFIDNQSIGIVYNGEIYNYLEIKHELKLLGHQFFSGTDTEVILRAYKQWGTNSFKKFNGMFAFAILDKRKDILILARDVAGIKPLYYSQNSNGFTFASEVKAFKHTGFDFTENPDWKIYFLSFGFIPEPYTTLKDVFNLKPGHLITYHFKSKKIVQKQFESLVFSNHIQSKEVAIEKIRHELNLAVDRHLISDAPIGMFLSGGIDSSILALLTAKKHTQLKTLSLTFNENFYNEEAHQNTIQKIINSHHKNYRVTQQDYLDAIPAIRNAFDQPSNDAINTWFITKAAKEEGLKAVLSGLGGDELFGGYPTFKRMGMIKNLRHLPLTLFKVAEHLPIERLKKLVYLQDDSINNDYLALRGFYTPITISKLIDATEGEITSCIQNFNYSTYQDTLKNTEYASYIEQNIYMRSQLLKDTDYMSMQHGIEVRLPFLDKDFLKLSHQIDPRIKFAGPKPKQFLIDCFKDILPASIYQRKKMGFTFPFQEWNKKHPDIQKLKSHPNKTVANLASQFLNNQLHWSRCFALLQIENQLPQKNTLFLTLKTFSHTGGIEKLNRILMKVGTDLRAQHLIRFYAMSAYDDEPDEKYVCANRFRGFNGHLISFIYNAVIKAKRSDVVMLSHINLATVGLLIKLYSPKTKVYLQAHGIEVWRELNPIKKLFLKKVDYILPVSAFTKQVLLDKHQVNGNKSLVLNNCIDPYFKLNYNQQTRKKIRENLKLSSSNKIIFTLTRLSSYEKYKGYDQVIKAISILKQSIPTICYIIAGKYDDSEYIRIQQLIREFNVTEQVKLTGYINDDDISTYFGIADVFVMPSKKEGFGIVFIEALACGLPVIAGNQDGSVDALKNGELGELINPDSMEELLEAIQKTLKINDTSYNLSLMKKTDEYFGYKNYKEKIKDIIFDRYATSS